MEEIKKGKNCFWIGQQVESPVGIIEYTAHIVGGSVVTSTRVNPSHRGKGIAERLLDGLADYARKEDFKLQARCSYVVRKFEENKKYDDVNAQK